MRFKIVKYLVLILVSFHLNFPVYAQIGGQGIYQVLDIPFSAKEQALGGSGLTDYRNPVYSISRNPAQLSSELHQNFQLTFFNYFIDVYAGSSYYVHDFADFGTMAFGLQFLDYKQFQRTDETGNLLGKFFSSEYRLLLSWSKSI